VKSNSVLKSSIFILSLAIAFAVINACLSYSEYNLYNDGKWESTKTQLDKGVAGAWSMMLTTPGLKGGELNLNAWCGYQELTLKKAIPVQKIEFSFRPHKVPFSAIINKTDSLSTGLFFYPHGEQKVIFYTADCTGRFLSKMSLPLPANHLRRGQVELVSDKDSIRIFFNQLPIGTIPFAIPPAVRPGFRGSSMVKNIYIDNIQITAPDGKLVLSEKFDFPFRLHKWSWLYLLVGMTILCLLLYVDQLSSFIAYSCVLVTAGITVFGMFYYYVIDHYTQDPMAIDWRGLKSTIERQDEVEKRLDITYPIDSIADKNNVILFIGSSQTWGSGASTAARTFTSIIEDSLRERISGNRLMVINGAVSGTVSDTMYAVYVRKLAKYRPILTVIDVSNNDNDTSVFRKNLQGFAAYNRQNGIATLFIEEPNDGVTRPSNKHMIMRAVAQEYHLSAIEMQSYLERNYENGFIWWDGIHLSDYGQILFANRITPIIDSILIRDALIHLIASPANGIKSKR
jgi:lysophospholipase L1-like esterase